MSTTRLLLVDDDDFVRSALARALDRTGAFSVLPAENGQRALELLEREPVNAILTDLQMPVMDGLTMIGHLFERGVRLPVAVMTGQAIAPPLAERLRNYGIVASFSKPVEIGTLADELQRSLDPETVGRIRGITLFGFLQLLEVERKTAVVVVHGAGSQGRCYFEDGQLVHAHTRRLQGIEAAYEILAWPDPTVEIFYKRRPRERTIREPLQHVLMEAARLLDERRRTEEEAGGEPAPAGAPERGAGTGRDARLVDAVLDEALEIAGVVGVALVQVSTGRVLGAAGGRASFDVALAAAAAGELMRAHQRWLGALDSGEALDDVIVTLGRRYHLIRPLDAPADESLYLVLSRERANLGQARQQLAKLARRLMP